MSRGAQWSFLGLVHFALIHCNGLNARKFCLKNGLALFEKHSYDFFKVAMEFVQGCPLTMSAWKP
jgi:hypothetical protein